MNRNYYIELRDRHKPEELKLIFILESPPVSGKYFYDETGKTSEPLFNEMMKLINYQPINKEDGLLHFKDEGYFLVDSTYKQINKLKGKKRDITILDDYNNLLHDLKKVCSDKNVPIVLVKANVCKLLEKKLKASGFDIRNNGIVIPFPSTGQQKRFHEKIKMVFVDSAFN